MISPTAKNKKLSIMSTEKNSVLDGKLTDEQIGLLYRKVGEIKKRSENLIISFQEALDVMQYIIIEGQAPQHLSVINETHAIKPIKRPWKKIGDIIYFSVISDGTSGAGWLKMFKNKGKISDFAEEILLSDKFIPTCGIKYNIAVTTGVSFLDKNFEIYTEDVHLGALSRKFKKPNFEVACLIRKKFSNKEILKFMGLSMITIMHEPFITVVDPKILCVEASGNNFLRAISDVNGGIWHEDCGFAYEVSREYAQTPGLYMVVPREDIRGTDR